MLLLIIWLIGGLFSVIPVVDQKQAFIEPSPHDGLMIVLLAACVAARVSFDRKLIPLNRAQQHRDEQDEIQKPLHERCSRRIGRIGVALGERRRTRELAQ